MALIPLLAACSQDYPLVANGYSKTADLSALDDHGLGNFAEPVAPGGCLLAFKAQPDISTLQIRVVVGQEVDKTYDSRALAEALHQEDFSKGVFVVSDAGLRFEKNYACDTMVR
jgi:hypothetical protein